jgi:hypothetical protein
VASLLAENEKKLRRNKWTVVRVWIFVVVVSAPFLWMAGTHFNTAEGNWFLGLVGFWVLFGAIEVAKYIKACDLPRLSLTGFALVQSGLRFLWVRAAFHPPLRKLSSRTAANLASSILRSAQRSSQARARQYRNNTSGHLFQLLLECLDLFTYCFCLLFRVRIIGEPVDEWVAIPLHVVK